ncbi:MAG: glycosyltransferase family 39 protein [archaeon]
MPRLLIAIFSIASIYVIYKIFVHLLNRKLAIILTILTAFNFNFLFQSTVVEPEHPFILLSMLVILYVLKNKDSMNLKKTLFLSALTLLACLFRTIGITLIPAVAIAIIKFDKKKIFELKKYKYAFVYAVLATLTFALLSVYYVEKFKSPTLPYTADKVLFMIDTEALTQLNGNPVALLLKPILNTLGYIYILPSLMFNAALTTAVSDIAHYSILPNLVDGKTLISTLASFPIYLYLYVLIGIFISIIIMTGFVYSILKKRSIIDWYFLFYALILLLYNYRMIRFLIPLVPVLFFYIYRAIQLIQTRINISRIVFSLAILLIVLNVFQSILYAISIHQNTDYDPNMKDVLEMGRWASMNLPRGTKIMDRWGRFGFDILYDIKEVTYPYNYNTTEVYNKVKQNGVEYVIEDSLEDMKGTYGWNRQAGPEPFIKDYKNKLFKLHTIGNCNLYRIT